MSNPHQISLSAAAALTKNYRDNNIGATIALAYDKAAIEEILYQPNCVQLRAYFGETTVGGKALVFVGVDAAGNDILSATPPKIADFGSPCPSFCSSPNDLNS